MQLLGQEVNHKKYGKGVITELAENKITVRFEESQKLFLHPEAFQQHLRLTNRLVQKKIDKLNEEKIRETEERKQKKERENKSRNRINKLKISVKSQVAFNGSEDKLKEAGGLEYIHTGYFLSGEMKDKPRIPANIQPNTAVILTDCGNASEEERTILGIAMVDENFLGSECNDGQIKLHKKHILILEEENRLLFWNYFKRETFPARWGRVPFKYFENHTMQKIIFDICNTVTGTEQKESALELYRYFCSLNKLSESL